MKIPVFYDSCLQGSYTALKLNSQWDVKLSSNLLVWRSFLCTRENSRLTLPHCKGYIFRPQWNGWDWSRKAEWIVNPVKRHFLWSLAYIHMSVCKDYIYFRLKPYFYFARFTSELRFEHCISLILVLNEENHPFIKILSISFYYTYWISTPSSLLFLVKQSQKRLFPFLLLLLITNVFWWFCVVWLPSFHFSSIFCIIRIVRSLRQQIRL